MTPELNRRRCQLIDKEIDDSLSDAERHELDLLQNEMLDHRRKVAPLPLEPLRRLHEMINREDFGLGS